MYHGTMAANMAKSSPCSLPIFLILLPIFVKVAKHITTRVSHVARLINGPRFSGVTRTCSGCSEDILVFLQLLTFRGGGGGEGGEGWGKAVDQGD